MRRILYLSLGLIFMVPILMFAQVPDQRTQVEASLKKGVQFFQTLNTHGGYVYNVTPDRKLHWGEGSTGEDVIEVQPPGTPAVGQSFLRAYLVTGDNQSLEAAKEAAFALIKGQNKHGGWNHKINFENLSDETVSFDDNQSQSAISFLMALNGKVRDKRVSKAVKRALNLMIVSQLNTGGWPHMYPQQGNYHDYATFNDGGINDCVRVMMEAHKMNPADKVIENSLRKAARFLMISQLPPPQPGWAQQYNEFLQPAWARTFEPPSVCPAVTVRNMNTLIDLYLSLGDETLLEPIPDAIRWLYEIRLENGKWARFVEIGTNKSLYYDRQRIRVNNVEELHPERSTGYGYETELESKLRSTENRYQKALRLGRKGLNNEEHPSWSKEEILKRLNSMHDDVQKVLNEQEANGAWITRNDRFKTEMPKNERWNGQYTVMDRISSDVFNQNMDTLCTYLELCKQLDE